MKEEAYLKLETTAEISLGKEINLVNKKDFNHLDLVIEAKNNRLKSEFFYIYDYEKFNNCSLLKENFNIFKVSNGINHNSSRIVIHYITKELKRRSEQFKKTDSKHSLTEIFKPSLNQFNDSDIVIANDFIRSMFPFEGCSYTGNKLGDLIKPVKFLTLVLALRIIWSLLPGAIIPWKSFKDFYKNDESINNFKKYQSFYDDLPKFLPSYNHSCVLFEFLEIFLSIFKNDFFLDLNNSIDLIFTAGQICFNRDEYKSNNESCDDLPELHKFYYKRGSSFYIIFIAYLRSLSKEVNSSSPVEFKTLFEFFKIDQYPPLEHKPLSQKALTLTIPSNVDGINSSDVNYFKLISNASNSTSRIYSSNHSFTRFENKFLDKFEINPYKIIDNFFSKSSKNYLLKFDNTLNFNDFKINDDISNMRSNLKKNPTLFENNKEFVSTFINEFNRYGFESNHELKNSNSDTFLNDTINFNFSSNFETIDKLPVRVSKLEITEWFINSWKYETFLGSLTNTIVVKLTKTIGDCDWLIISSNDKISSNNRYLTPDEMFDLQKEKEFNNVLSTPKKKIISPKKRKSPNSKDLLKRRISVPSKPNNISNFEKEFNAQVEGFEMLNSNKLSSNTGKNLMNKLNDASNKPLPTPTIPNQRIQTPQNQIIEGFSDFDTPGKPKNDFLPPPLVKNSVNDNSLISNNNLALEDHFELQAIIDDFDEKSNELDRSNSKLFVGGSLRKPYVSNKRSSNHPYHQLKSTPKLNEARQEFINIVQTPPNIVKLESPSNVELKEIESSATITTSTETIHSAEEARQNSIEFNRSRSELKKKGSPISIQQLKSKTASQFETPPTSAVEKFSSNSIRRFTKLNLSMNNSSGPSSKIIKTSVRSATSPIASKFSFLSSKKDKIKKVSPSESNNSLSFINDGTDASAASHLKISTANNKNPFLLSKDSTTTTSLVSTRSEIPEITYTPQAFRKGVSPSSANESSISMVSNFQSASSQKSSNELAEPSKLLDDVISLNRESFISNSPVSKKNNMSFNGSNNDLNDEENDDSDMHLTKDTRDEDTQVDLSSDSAIDGEDSVLTADTTKNVDSSPTSKKISDLDGLMSDIKETMKPKDEFFSTDELSSEGVK